MKKKAIIILGTILSLIAIMYVHSCYNEMKKTEKKAVEKISELLAGISSNEYDKVASCLRKKNGTELTKEEIDNFLINTRLYNAAITHDENRYFKCNAKAKLFQKNNVDVEFSFFTLSDDKIACKLVFGPSENRIYVDDGELKNNRKERKKYYFKTDLADGSKMKYESENDAGGDNKEEIIHIIYKAGQDKDGKVYYDVLEEGKTALLAYLQYELDATTKSLEENKENFTILWNKDYSKMSVYTKKGTNELNSIVTFEMYYNSMMKQILEENQDWKFEIDYYDYDTKEFVGKEAYR